MKIVILSGGSGNDALIKGIKKIFSNNNELDINVIVNAYDNGKSTGVCRAVTDTLGVSDIRKNHSRMYEATYGDNVNANLMEFYNKRYDFSKGHEEDEVVALLKKWGMGEYEKYAHNFFANPKAKDFEYKDFSVSNIIYSQMYKEIGYEKTNKHFCDRMKIDDFVTLNSFDNVYIKSKTQSGYVIPDEGEMVFWNNADNKIVETIFEGKSEYGLNPKAINLVNTADCIIVSTGTFWSSIQPTIKYLDFYKYINQSKAKKIWAINNEEDGDSFGVSGLEFYDNMEKSGLCLSDFTILLNNDARESLKQTDNKHKFVFKTMGNNKGKHDGQLYAKAIMQVYYGLDNDFDTILFDFDDTLWARATTPQQETISKDNIQYLNSNLAQKSIIVSGNSYESIKEKLSRIYGSDLEGFNIDIWADANSTLYKHNKVVEMIDKMLLDAEADKLAKDLEERYGIKAKPIGQKLVNYRIKPLTPLERKLLVEMINSNKDSSYVARATGTTTVDVLSKNNSKSAIFDHCNLKDKKTLYIGDETDKGNDADIANKCTKSINVKNVEETNILVRILGE